MPHLRDIRRGVTDRRTDGRTDGGTDRPSYRDAMTHLKRASVYHSAFCIPFFFLIQSKQIPLSGEDKRLLPQTHKRSSYRQKIPVLNMHALFAWLSFSLGTNRRKEGLSDIDVDKHENLLKAFFLGCV